MSDTMMYVYCILLGGYLCAILNMLFGDILKSMKKSNFILALTFVILLGAMALLYKLGVW